MDFELTDNQKMIRKMVREFAEKEIAPVAEETDKEEIYPHETLKKMAPLGL
ncbi:MAG: acyl-CoA dehydrogenase family protein, partial [Thermoplasmata archaeon]